MLRGRANLSGATQRGNDSMVPHLTGKADRVSGEESSTNNNPSVSTGKPRDQVIHSGNKANKSANLRPCSSSDDNIVLETYLDEIRAATIHFPHVKYVEDFMAIKENIYVDHAVLFYGAYENLKDYIIDNCKLDKGLPSDDNLKAELKILFDAVADAIEHWKTYNPNWKEVDGGPSLPELQNAPWEFVPPPETTVSTELIDTAPSKIARLEQWDYVREGWISGGVLKTCDANLYFCLARLRAIAVSVQKTDASKPPDTAAPPISAIEVMSAKLTGHVANWEAQDILHQAHARRDLAHHIIKKLVEKRKANDKYYFGSIPYCAKYIEDALKVPGGKGLAARKKDQSVVPVLTPPSNHPTLFDANKHQLLVMVVEQIKRLKRQHEALLEEHKKFGKIFASATPQPAIVIPEGPPEFWAVPLEMKNKVSALFAQDGINRRTADTEKSIEKLILLFEEFNNASDATAVYGINNIEPVDMLIDTMPLDKFKRLPDKKSINDLLSKHTAAKVKIIRSLSQLDCAFINMESSQWHVQKSDEAAEDNSKLMRQELIDIHLRLDKNNTALDLIKHEVIDELKDISEVDISTTAGELLFDKFETEINLLEDRSKLKA